MKSFPIIPIWLMIIISIIYILLILKTNNKKKLIIRILIIVLIFIINLRFMTENKNGESYVSDLDIIMVVDNSISMVAEDYNGNNRRLDEVKDDLKYILDNIPSSSYSIITFDSKSYIRSPFTPDRDNIDSIIDTMDVKLSYYSNGSNITIFKNDLKYLLKSSKKKDNHKRIVILVSDGEVISSKGLVSLKDLKKYIDDGIVLGYGTTKGGKMKEKLYTTSKEYEYVEDRRGSTYPPPKAISKINENNLKKMANDLGIDYIHMTKQSKVNNKIKKISNKSSLSESKTMKSYKDTYYPFAIILSILVLMELYLDRRDYL